MISALWSLWPKVYAVKEADHPVRTDKSKKTDMAGHVHLAEERPRNQITEPSKEGSRAQEKNSAASETDVDDNDDDDDDDSRRTNFC